MFSISVARALTKEAQSNMDVLEELIDGCIFDRVKTGHYNCTIIIGIDCKSVFDTYKEVLSKYKRYSISYGFNHNGDHLINIEWAKEKEEEILNA